MALAVAGMGASLTSCQNDYTIPELDIPVAQNKANITIREVKELWAGVAGQQVGTKENGEHYIIHGRVISSDANGNVYKSLVIQDETAAVSFSINAASMYTTFPLGQEVVVDITGLYVGRYSNLFQIGMLSDYKGTPSIGFMNWEIFKRHAEKNGLPNTNFKYVKYGDTYPTENPYCILTTIGGLPTGDAEKLLMMSQLVEFSDVKFPGANGKTTFSTYQSSGDNRSITDATGGTLNVRTSGYASFYNTVLPEGEGSVRGLLSVFGTDWQLTLRNIQDVMFGTQGSTMQNPNTVAQALEYDNNGRAAWTSGVIVGCVKAGVDAVTSASDIAWTSTEIAQDGMDDNLVIAGDAAERDITKVMVVRLPQGSKFRKYGNVLDNPTVLGKNIVVRGKYTALYGIHGISDNAGRPSDFSIDGVSTGAGKGAGTETDPYNVAAVIELEGAMNNVWVSGYIVGFVEGTTFGTGAKFTGDTAGANYNGANLIIADEPNCTDLSKCIPVAVDRNKFGLIKNPAFYQKQITLFGNVGTYLGAQGMPTTDAAKNKVAQ